MGRGSSRDGPSHGSLTHDTNNWQSQLHPGLGEEAYEEWQKAGCKRIGEFFDWEGFKSFEQVKKDYGLPEGE